MLYIHVTCCLTQLCHPSKVYYFLSVLIKWKINISLKVYDNTYYKHYIADIDISTNT